MYPLSLTNVIWINSLIIKKSDGIIHLVSYIYLFFCFSSRIKHFLNHIPLFIRFYWEQLKAIFIFFIFYISESVNFDSLFFIISLRFINRGSNNIGISSRIDIKIKKNFK